MIWMQQIHIRNSTPDWEDDFLSLSSRQRAIGWALVAILTPAAFLPWTPFMLKFLLFGIAGLLFIFLNMDAGWRQQQSNNLRHTSEVLAAATGLSASELSPALRTAAIMERTVLNDGQKLSIQREDQGFTVTLVEPRYAVNGAHS